MTYGQVARMSGNPRAARQVVRILHSMSEKYGLPWHRVVNYKGCIAIKDDEFYNWQKATLEVEGVAVDRKGCISLDIYQWNGTKG